MKANPELRLLLIEHPNLPADLLSKFAEDEREIIRANVALSEKAPPAILESLCRDARFAVRRSVAKNPNTAVHVLEQLSSDSNRDVLLGLVANSQTPLTVLLKLVEILDMPGRKRIASVAPCEPSIIEKLAADENPKVRRSLASNPNLTDDMILQLLRHHDLDLRCALARRVRLSVQATNFLLEMGIREILAFLAANPFLAASDLHRVFEKVIGSTYTKSRDIDTKALQYLCHNPNLTAELQLRIALEYPEMRRSLGFNANASPELLHILADDEDLVVRCRAAVNEATPSKVLAKLTNDSASVVRRYALWNTATPSEYCSSAIKASDEDWQIRNRVASQSDTEAEILELLATDEKRDVRASIAGNPSTPKHILEQLVAGDDPWIRRRAAHNCGASSQLLNHLWELCGEDIASALAWNPRSSAELLDELSQHDDGRIQRGVILNNATLLSTLKCMTGTSAKHLRRELRDAIDKKMPIQN